jgi:hypothetical protein
MVRLKHGTPINPYAYTASKAVGGLISAATGDLAVIRTQTRPRGRKHAPVELELHLNPASIGIGAVGLGLALWLTQQRVSQQDVAEMRMVVDSPEHYVEATGHYEATGEGTIVGRGYSAGAMRWVQDSPGYMVPAVTHEEPTGKILKKFVIKERQGFLGSGSGTTTDETRWKLLRDIGLGGWWSPWW